MSSITQLPDRPLRQGEIASIDEQGLNIVPYGGIPADGGVEIYAMKMASTDTAYALVFDDGRAQWRRLASTDATDLAAADSQLDAVIDDWVQGNYGGRFEVLKTV